MEWPGYNVLCPVGKTKEFLTDPACRSGNLETSLKLDAGVGATIWIRRRRPCMWRELPPPNCIPSDCWARNTKWGAHWLDVSFVHGRVPIVWRRFPGSMSGALALDWVKMRMDPWGRRPQAWTERRQRLGRHRRGMLWSSFGREDRRATRPRYRRLPS